MVRLVRMVVDFTVAVSIRVLTPSTPGRLPVAYAGSLRWHNQTATPEKRALLHLAW